MKSQLAHDVQAMLIWGRLASGMRMFSEDLLPGGMLPGKAFKINGELITGVKI